MTISVPRIEKKLSEYFNEDTTCIAVFLNHRLHPMVRETDHPCPTSEYSTIYRLLIAMFSHVIESEKDGCENRSIPTLIITNVDENREPRKIPETTPQIAFDKDGSKYAVCPCISVSIIGHRTVTYTVKRIGKISRYYYDDLNEFKLDLAQYRSNIGFQKDFSSDGANVNNTNFVCVGLANVRLKFCSLCFDIKKKNDRELYFVDKNDISRHRTTLCYGCLGSILMKMKCNEEEI